MERIEEINLILSEMKETWVKTSDLSFTDFINELLKSVEEVDGKKSVSDDEILERLKKFKDNSQLLGLLRDFEKLVK